MALFDQSMFNPQAYSGLLGSLLQGLQFQQPQPSQGFPDSQGSYGGVQYPIFGQQPQTQELSAQSVQPQAQYAPQQQLPSALQPPPGGNLGAGLSGFANARGILPAISNLVSGITTGQRTDPSGMAQQSAQATYQALKAAGVPEGVAQAGALNPDVLKTIAPQIYTKPQFGVVGENQLGVKQYGFIDPSKQTVNPVNATGGQAGSPGIDPSLTGQEFLAAVASDPQLGPGKAQMVKAIAEGRQPYPSGFLLKTPFGQWLTTAVGQYEPNLDATLIRQRATFNQQMGSATPSSAGGQKILMGTSLGHLAKAAETAASLENYDTPVALLGQGINAVKNMTTAQAAKVNALNETVDRFAGEVGKLYSGSQGGGVTERDQTRARFGGARTSAELAGALEASKELIKSKLQAQEDTQDQLRINPQNRIDFLGQNGRDAIARIDTAIAKLRGQSAPSQSAPSQSGSPKQVSTKSEYDALPKGAQYVAPDGSVRTKN